jgi:hypothetical protein
MSYFGYGMGHSYTSQLAKILYTHILLNSPSTSVSKFKKPIKNKEVLIWKRRCRKERRPRRSQQGRTKH